MALKGPVKVSQSELPVRESVRVSLAAASLPWLRLRRGERAYVEGSAVQASGEKEKADPSRVRARRGWFGMTNRGEERISGSDNRAEGAIRPGPGQPLRKPKSNTRPPEGGRYKRHKEAR